MGKQTQDAARDGLRAPVSWTPRPEPLPCRYLPPFAA